MDQHPASGETRFGGGKHYKIIAAELHRVTPMTVNHIGTMIWFLKIRQRPGNCMKFSKV
jgi:hypothetical protein